MITNPNRHVSPQWTLAKLRRATSRKAAADYFEDYWQGWIAGPMLGRIDNGGWARLALACIAVESLAYFWKPLAGWQGLQVPGTGGQQLPVLSGSELGSQAAFRWMFREIFSTHSPQGIQPDDLSVIAYKVFRCGLAHRGLSKNCLDTHWLGVI